MAYSGKDKRGVAWELLTIWSLLQINNKWWVQYLVIYAVHSHFNHCNSFNRCCAIVVCFSDLLLQYFSDAFQQS